MATKLTEPQIKCLTYYRALTDKDKETLRVLRSRRRASHNDPRVIERMREEGFLAVVGYNYGPIHGITEAGRKALDEA